MIGLLLALLSGVLLGTLTGLTPGIHINLISGILLASSPFLLIHFSPLILAILVISMSITHTFLDFIPSIFLGAPDEDSALSVLPGHQMLLKGRAYEAVIFTLYGSLLAIPIILLLIPLLVFLLPQAFSYLKYSMFLILISASLYLVLKEESKLKAFFIFLLAGFLGITSFLLPLKDSLLPLLTGLFGSSALINSLTTEKSLPKQIIPKIKDIKPNKNQIKKISLATILASPLCSFLPSLGSSQAAVIGSDLLGEFKEKEFLMLLGSVNTIVMGVSFFTLYSINKARTGSAATVIELMKTLEPSFLGYSILAILLSASLASIMTILSAKIFAKNITKVSYRKLSIIILILLTLSVISFSGLLGFLVFITATFLGLSAILLKIRRAHLMGSLMLLSILLYIP